MTRIFSVNMLPTIYDTFCVMKQMWINDVPQFHQSISLFFLFLKESYDVEVKNKSALKKVFLEEIEIRNYVRKN